MIDPSFIALVSAATALVASITGPIVTLYVGRAQIRAAVRSANRQKWIEEFRDLTAHFCGQVATGVQLRHKVVADGRIKMPEQSEIVAFFDRLMYTATKLKLMINPLDDQHVKLVEIINRILQRFREAPLDEDLHSEAFATVKEIVDTCLSISRREWLLVQAGG